MPSEDLLKKVLIVGGGPAGACLGIRLARAGHSVRIVEKDVFPREKLCGEFISPESFELLQSLGVYDELLAAGATRIRLTRFNSRGGRRLNVPTYWFGSGDFALGLSRARFDQILLSAAVDAGVDVVCGARVVSVNADAGRIVGVETRLENAGRVSFEADLYVDASGRNAVLSPGDKREGEATSGSGWIAYKTHLRSVDIERDVCEMFSFDGGYGGLSPVEDGKANLCLIMRGQQARNFIGNSNSIPAFLSAQNLRAAKCLSGAEVAGRWLAVKVDSYGVRDVVPYANSVAIGDANAFIDPFTGSGIFSAVESAGLLADFMLENDFTAARYRSAIASRVRRRHSVSRVLRRTASSPRLATLLIATAAAAAPATRFLARATRTNAKPAADNRV